MRIIPKKIKVKNTVWKCYSMMDVIVALIVFAIIFILITAGNWAFAIVMGLIAVVMFMPTPDGIFYTCIFENVKFLFAKKRYTADAKNPKTAAECSAGSLRSGKRTSALRTWYSRISTSATLQTR